MILMPAETSKQGQTNSASKMTLPKYSSPLFQFIRVMGDVPAVLPEGELGVL